MSIDSLRIRGLEDESIDDQKDDVTKAGTPSKMIKNKSAGSTESAQKVEIKTAKIEVQEPTGLLSERETTLITDTLHGLGGVVDCQIQTNVLPNIVQVSYRSNGTPLRDIIKAIHEAGF